MEPLYLTSALLILSCLLLWMRYRPNAHGGRVLPPSPPALPLIGHLHLLTSLPHQGLQKIASKYGPLVWLKLGANPTVLVTSPKMAREFLKVQDAKFASRPHIEVAQVISYGFFGMGFSPYGENWRQTRKLCSTEVLNGKTVDGFRESRTKELSLLMNDMWVASQEREFVDITTMMRDYMFNAFTVMLMSKRYFGPHASDAKEAAAFVKAKDDVIVLLGKFNIRDYFPKLRWLDSSVSRMTVLQGILDVVMQKIVDEHMHQDATKKERPDFCDILLDMSRDLGYEKQNKRCKALLEELMVAGADSTIVVIEWGMAELLQNPQIMQRAQKEIAEVVGKDRLVEELDIPKLPYFNAIIKEILRLHPPTPLMLPHQSMEDTQVDGYFIPQGTRVFVNVYAIARDPSLWENPLQFMPERFLGSNIDVHGQHFELLPFGAGRRGCPGQALGMTFVQLTIANLLHAFDWELPAPGKIPMEERFGLVMSLAALIRAKPTPRLPLQIYTSG